MEQFLWFVIFDYSKIKQHNIIIYLVTVLYKAKKQLTAIDWNFHINLSTATSRSGNEIRTRKYNPRTREWDIKVIKVDKGYEYIPILMSKIMSRRLHVDCVTRNISLNASDPGNLAPNIAHKPAPCTKDITDRRSRFAKKD